MGEQKTIYMTYDQIKQLKEVQELTNESFSAIIRKGVNMYSIKLKDK